MLACTLCTLGDEPGCEACRAVEPEGEPAPSIVYRIRHVPTGRIYVGVHATDGDPYEDDGYMGSGSAIRPAVEEDRAAFRKEILAVCSDARSAYALERGLVGPEQVASGWYFNQRVGGLGGLWHLSDEAEAHRRERLREVQQTEEWKEATVEACRRPERCAKLSNTHRVRYEDPAERELTGEHSRRVWDDYTEEERAARVEEIADRNREQATDAEWLAATTAAARKRFEDPAEREKQSELSKRTWASLPPDKRAARVAEFSERTAKARQHPTVKAKMSDAAALYWARMTPDERSAVNKRRAVAAKLRRQVLDALASAHGLADVVAERRTREKVARSAEMRRRRSVGLENKRVKREVGMIFLALVAAKYGDALTTPPRPSLRPCRG